MSMTHKIIISITIINEEKCRFNKKTIKYLKEKLIEIILNV